MRFSIRRNTRKRKMRRSVDLGKGLRKNDTTKKANDKFRKGELGE